MIEPATQHLENHLLAILEERNPFTTLDRLHKTGRYITAHFESLSLPVQEEKVLFEGTESVNVLGVKEGKSRPDEVFILAAHYDTVEGTPGADDNGSAVAALLEIARCLEPVPLDASLLYAAFTLEEYGFIGSRHFIAQAENRNKHWLGMISLEMVGFCSRQPGSQSYPPYVDASRYPDTGDFIAVVGNEPSAQLTLSVAENIKRTVPGLGVESLIVPGRGDEFTEVQLSDHSPFWEYGTPAVMLTDTAFFRNPNYHQSTDTFDTLDLEFIRDVSKGVAGYLESTLA